MSVGKTVLSLGKSSWGLEWVTGNEGSKTSHPHLGVS